MKRKFEKILNLFIILFFICSFGMVYANDGIESKISKVEYSEDYKQWLELSDEEKGKRLEPRKYDVITERDNASYFKNINNIFKAQQLMKARLSDKYNLKDVIPENVAIKNQMQTNSCWAFATLGVLESNLALKDKIASRPTVTYDFSEKHMNYATAKYAFLNGEINEGGLNRKVSDGGNFYIATQYLAGGKGAIIESDLPFENSEEDIDISQIKNKEVKTTIYDTTYIESKTPATKDEIMPQIKENIVNYGGIYAGIHGAQIFGNNYNNETGAIYCTSPLLQPSNHAVVIIGWDDNYSKDNFNEKNKPKEDGAWIIKNSWGENMVESLKTLKEQMFEANQSECEENGWKTPEEIPTDVIVNTCKQAYGESKVSVDGDNLVVEIGNKGYMYISYEDCNVYRDLSGIEKATNSKDYDNVYQNDELGISNVVELNEKGTINIANVFKRDASKEEELDKVTINTMQDYTCKVYVNPNNDSKALEDLQEVKLAEGDTETFGPGYHTLEFANPVKLTGNSFVVVVQISNDYSQKLIPLESNVENSPWSEVKVGQGESYISLGTTFDESGWQDLAILENEELRGNATIKAYTNEIDPSEKKTLTEIYISNEPTKTTYIEGENFDKSGMVVMAKYNDDSTKEITDYEIIGGDNLTLDTSSVTIKYIEEGITKTVTQAIKVMENDDEVPTDPDDDKPVSSDFNNAKSAITETKLFFNSKDLTKATSEITMKISGIKLGNENNKYTHYYHISGTQGDEDIKDWEKADIKKEKDGTYSITLNIKSEELKNYSEIIESDNLYVYIKEVAESGKEKVEKISTLSVENQSEPVCYVDGKKVGTIDDVINYDKNNGNNNQQGKDNTIASGKLPHAGNATVIAIIVIIGLIGGFTYFRYKNIDR